jgi:hypothetical protein
MADLGYDCLFVFQFSMSFKKTVESTGSTFVSFLSDNV